MAELVFVGDSLIEYFDWTARFPAHRVYNLGRSGETVDELGYRLKRVITTTSQPDFILIMSGTNNVAMEDTGFTETYREIIQRLQNAFPTARVVIHSLPPIILPWFNSQLVEQANAKITALAAATGTTLLDVNAIFAQAGEADCLAADGVHINDQGYQLWSAAVAELIGA